MLTIRDEIFKILGYVPKSSCQSTTFEPTTIKDRIFLMLGYIPESQCIPITPAPPPSLLPRPTPTPITPTPPHIPIIPPTPPHIPIIPPTVMSLNILASPSNAGTVYPISISNITSLTSATITATPNSGYQFTGWTLNGTPLSITSSSLSLSQIFSLLQPGTNNLVANFKQIVKTFLQFSALPGGSITNGGQTIDITDYLLNPSNALLNIIATPKTGYYFAGFTLNGHDITSYTNITQSIGCAKQTIKSAINNIKLSNLIQNFRNYINIGSTNILSASFKLLPWKIIMKCPCQSNGSAKCTFNVYDINGNPMYNVPIFIKETVDGIVKHCFVSNSNDVLNIPYFPPAIATVVVDVYAVQNLNAHANSGTIGLPCISL